MTFHRTQNSDMLKKIDEIDGHAAEKSVPEWPWKCAQFVLAF